MRKKDSWSSFFINQAQQDKSTGLVGLFFVFQILDNTLNKTNRTVRFKQKPPKFKDIPWNSKPVHRLMVEDSPQIIYAADVGEYTMFHTVSKKGKARVSTYILRKGKKTVINELTKSLFVLKMEDLGYFFDREVDCHNKKTKLIVKKKDKGILHKITDLITK